MKNIVLAVKQVRAAKAVAWSVAIDRPTTRGRTAHQRRKTMMTNIIQMPTRTSRLALTPDAVLDVGPQAGAIFIDGTFIDDIDIFASVDALLQADAKLARQ
jgi:hypothetical protein